jgi:hypothetical protein
MSAEPEKPDPAASPFELDAPAKAAPRAVPGDAPVPVPVPAGIDPQGDYERAIRQRADLEDKPEVDTRTFAEKKGVAPIRATGVLPPPPHWPLEALRFPFRGHGPGFLAGTTAAVFVLDFLVWTDFRFLSWMLKTPALLFVIRWQLDLIGHSAAGKDEPVGWRHAIDVDKQGVKSFGWFVVQCFATALPSMILWTLRWLGWVHNTGPWEVGLLIVGSAWMSVYALGSALEDSRLKRPWVTVAWLFYRPLTCLAGSLGWWALGVAEVTVLALAKTDTWAAIPAAIVLRATSIYALMLSARVLGVLGRRWDPAKLGPA